ncbi:MAG: hypothetical protein ACXABY_30585 [Candidatus Thorarchaeota archaeon]|jgi:hypothetical protein
MTADTKKKLRRLVVLDEILHDGFCRANNPEKAQRFEVERKDLFEELSGLGVTMADYYEDRRKFKP